MKINGKIIDVNSKPSSYANITRIWENGDVIEWKMSMSLRTESMPDNPDRIAVFYSPTLLAADLGFVDKPALEGYANKVLLTKYQPLNEWIEPVENELLLFKTVNVGKPNDVELIPFFTLHDQRYTIYMDKYTQKEWEREEEKIFAEQERKKELEHMTIDYFQPGEMQPERDHNLKSERSTAGEAFGKKWRHAVDGGWFSFDMNV